MNVYRMVSLSAIVGLGLTACSDGGNVESQDGDALETVTVGHVQLPIFSPLYVADAKGYFEDEGIELEFENIKSGQEAVPLAANGELDVVAAGFSAGMFSAVETGLDISIVGSMGVQPAEAEEEQPPSALIVRKDLYDDGTIESVADLEGRDVGAPGGGGATSAFYVSMALEEQDLGINDVDFVQLSSPDIPAALESGSIDAAFVSAPFWNLAVDDGTAEEMWTTPEGTSGTGLLYGGDFSESDLAQPFFNAAARGAQDLQGEERYSDENLEAIGAATDQSADDVAEDPLYTWHPDLHPLPEQLAEMERIWMEAGAIDYENTIPQGDYIDSSFADEVDASTSE